MVYVAQIHQVQILYCRKLQLVTRRFVCQLPPPVTSSVFDDGFD